MMLPMRIDQVRSRRQRREKEGDEKAHCFVPAVTKDGSGGSGGTNRQRGKTAGHRDLVVGVIAGEIARPHQQPQVFADHLDGGEPRSPEAGADQRVVGERNRRRGQPGKNPVPDVQEDRHRQRHRQVSGQAGARAAVPNVKS